MAVQETKITHQDTDNNLPGNATADLLVLNAGSSSLKYALFERDGDLTMPQLTGQVAGIDQHAAANPGATGDSQPHPQTHSQALQEVLARVGGARIVAVGHRIVHGGMRFVQPVRIDDAVLQALEQLVPLAPLHQPNGLAGVRAAMAAFPGVPQIACFDTAFHAEQPDVNQRFALPRALHDAGVRRYGFHGLSYESVMAQLARFDPAVARGRVVVAHLGNGASMCAIHDGKSVATTMSFSPLDGLTMGTRCGQLDAAVVLYLMQARGMAAEQITNLLYRESGLLGLSGVSSDMRELQASRLPEAAQAVTHFVEQVLQNLGKLAAAMRGLDALVFTGGIGENATDLRARIMAGAAWLGLQPDPAANQSGALRISAPGIAVSAWVVKTNEEAMIARHTATLLL